MIKLLPFFLIGLATHGYAQVDPAADTLQPSYPQEIRITKAVEISATRLTTTDLKSPLAVTVLDQSRLQKGTQQLSMYEHLSAVPGVFAMNPDNFSQDLRISIRGFGARAAFGIRGIRIFTDGMPEGTPDGQVDVDNLDLGIVRQMEVLRGAASGLYGNAAGGVILLQTENPLPKKPLLEAQASVGSYGFQRYQLKIGQNFGKFLYFLNGSYHKTEGYRSWSNMENTILNGKVTYRPCSNCQISLLANYGNSPRANDPGGLNASQVEANPKQAGASNLLFETGEAVAQYRIGLTYDQQINKKHRIQGRIFSTSRHLENRLAIQANGFGDLTRHYYGAYLSYQFDGTIKAMTYRLKSGIDVEHQADTRLRFAYKSMLVDSVTRYFRDKNVLQQLEAFTGTGVYLLQELYPAPALLIAAGIRYDDLKLRVTDRFISDGDQSGDRHFQKLNPILGINYAIAKGASLYANYASTFESPTLNELSNNPSGNGGFNPGLDPQQSGSYEAGAKGHIPAGKTGKSLQFDIALYHIETQRDIVPYQLDGQPGKTFYRNAGKSDRNGLEIGLNYPVFKTLKVFYTQTFSRFRYRQYSANGNVYDGKYLPGIPGVHTQLELRYFHTKGLFVILQAKDVRKVYANDANTAFAVPYSLLNLRMGYTCKLRLWQVEPFMGANNLTNTRYIANVQVNAANDRFFEPAALLYVWAGIKVKLIKG